MSNSMLTVLGVGFIVIVLTFWLHHRGALASDAARCGNCKKAYSAPAGSPCPKCGRGHTLTAPSARTVQVRSSLTIIGALVMEILLLLGALYIAFTRSRPLTPGEYARTRCPKCSLKLRYPPGAGGREGKCPQCKHVFVFPSSDSPKPNASPSRSTDATTVS